MVKLNFDEISYVESLKDYPEIRTKEMYYVTHMTMKKMEETLLSEVFIRINKTYILSLSGLKSLFFSINSKYNLGNLGNICGLSKNFSSWGNGTLIILIFCFDGILHMFCFHFKFELL